MVEKYSKICWYCLEKILVEMDVENSELTKERDWPGVFNKTSCAFYDIQFYSTPPANGN